VADDRSPCLVGVGQVVARDTDPAATEPLELWAQAVAAAADDCGAAEVLRSVDALTVVRIDSFAYDDAAGRLATRLSLGPGARTETGLGGHQPLLHLAQLAEGCRRGEYRVAALAGGEALATVRALRRAGEPLPWAHADPRPEAPDLEGVVHPSELAHGLLPIMRSFALRDVARRAHLGAAPEDYRLEPGPAYADMTKVAAANPFAWHREARPAQELVTPSADNRQPVHPYTKRLMASPDVNLAAACLVASASAADDLGVPPERRVHLWGTAACRDFPYPAEQPDLHASPGMARAFGAALAAAGLDQADVDLFDLYSAFPAAVRFACDALGRPLDDPRGVTVTGGMPYAGAPGSNTTAHALAAMVDRLREAPGAVGLVSGLTAQMAAHAVVVLSAGPGPPAVLVGQPAPPAGEPVPIALAGRGPAELLAYAVACDRAGDDEWAVAVCGLPDGRRCYGATSEPEVLAWLAGTEAVGSPVRLAAGGDGTNRLLA